VKNQSFGRSRRHFLELLVVTAGGALASTACGGNEGKAPEHGGGSEYFPQSIASGDPRPNTVVLWTRVVDPERRGEDLELELEVSTDEQFNELVMLDGESRLTLTASADADGCVKLRLTELEPHTTYYYRFSYRAPDRELPARSRVGRTKTAPAESADVALRFAAVSCQDYEDKYFYVYEHLSGQELDFVVHLGDYVYEGGSAQTSTGAVRSVVFGSPDEALGSEGPAGATLVARSLDNYRDLYRTTRSDPALQRAHELFPFIVIPDDHEFSDDSHGATATYRDGQSDETDYERRAAADQAWFEYMPVDYTDPPTRELDARRDFPDDFTIYRSFAFGRHLELVMTDLRRYRPDHLIPEDAFPGEVFMTEDELEEEGVPTELAVPYVDVDTFEDGAYQEALAAGADELGFRTESVQGLLSVPWINQQLELLDADEPEAIDPDDESLARGLAYHQLLKDQEFSRIGSRYFVAQEPFEALARRRFRETDGASERLMGDEQRDWFLETMQGSSRTFKVWGSEIAFLQKHIDLTGFRLAPPELQQRIGLTAEDWDGFPNERGELLAELSRIDNVVILSGDLHCFFAATPFDPADSSRAVVEFTIGSVTSTTWLEGIESLVETNPSLPPSVATLAPLVGTFLTSKAPRANPHLAFQELAKNGYAVLAVSGQALDAELFMLAPADVATPYEAGRRLPAFTSSRFRVRAGSSTLERPAAAGFERWDVDEMEWIES
jgi:alkaline phosphatase D